MDVGVRIGVNGIGGIGIDRSTGRAESPNGLHHI
jgi:hypothetical protein